MENDQVIKNVWVCWELPRQTLPADTIVLSFLSPGTEHALKQKHPGQVISAREQAHEVRDRALEIYCNIVAGIGTVPVKAGITLRAALKQGDLCSLWWFHKVSVKDLETEPTYDLIIYTLIINRFLEKNNFVSVEIYGAHEWIVDVIKKKFEVVSKNEKKENLFVQVIIAILKRVKAFCLMCRDVIGVKRSGHIMQGTYDVLFSSFWDWSFTGLDDGDLKDRYYQSLPDKLEARNKKTGRLLWLSHRYQQKKRRTLKSVLEPLIGKKNYIIVQNYLKLTDVFRAFFNFNGLFYYSRAVWQDKFKDVFMADGLDLYPLFRVWMWTGFLDGNIPYYELVYKAHKNALEKNNTKILFGYMNLYPHARAVYAAAKGVSRKPVLCDIQHASYSWETTIGRLDKVSEFIGNPDGCGVPHADHMCVMGELGREVFGSCGFTDDQILMTGSSRYDYVFSAEMEPAVSRKSKGNILIVTAMDLDSEIEMVNAVFNAFENDGSVNIQLRSHPFSPILKRKDFKRFQSRIRVTEKTTLDEDLNWSDIVVCSYSTVGEEAFIRGIPVWQWNSAGANASVFRAIKVVPVFASVQQLKDLYKAYEKNSKDFMPSDRDRKLIKDKCFYSLKGYPTDNIADFVLSLDTTKERICQ